MARRNHPAGFRRYFRLSGSISDPAWNGTPRLGGQAVAATELATRALEASRSATRSTTYAASRPTP